MLKPYRNYSPYDGSLRNFGAAVMERGGVVVATGTTPSGAALDDPNNGVNYAANPSGWKPVGILLNDVVNRDLTKQPLNWNKSEAQVGDKVLVVRRGEFTTNWINLTGTNQGAITRQQNAYLNHSGYLTNDSREGHPLVGKFLDKQDQDGYALVFIDI